MSRRVISSTFASFSFSCVVRLLSFDLASDAELCDKDDVAEEEEDADNDEEGDEEDKDEAGDDEEEEAAEVMLMMTTIKMREALMRMERPMRIAMRIRMTTRKKRIKRRWHRKAETQKDISFVGHANVHHAHVHVSIRAHVVPLSV
jgi:hypothetical protein